MSQIPSYSTRHHEPKPATLSFSLTQNYNHVKHRTIIIILYVHVLEYFKNTFICKIIVTLLVRDAISGLIYKNSDCVQCHGANNFDQVPVNLYCYPSKPTVDSLSVVLHQLLTSQSYSGWVFIFFSSPLSVILCQNSIFIWRLLLSFCLYYFIIKPRRGKAL